MKHKILVIDDEESILDLVTAYLHQEGYEYYTARDGPSGLKAAQANNPDLMRQIGEVTAKEMIATGIYWNYAPAVSVPQDIRWGRTYEGYSENIDIVSSLASAYLQGMQGDDLAAIDTVLGTPKHFVGDGGTAWGSSTSLEAM